MHLRKNKLSNEKLEDSMKMYNRLGDRIKEDKCGKAEIWGCRKDEAG